MRRERAAFRAMGTDVVVLAEGAPDGALASARALVERCEARWSRFLPGSELSRLNAAAGHPVLLPPETYALVAASVAAWRATAGRFDPTVLPALVAAGYDRTFEDVAAPGAIPGVPAPGCGGIVLDDVLGAVQVPAGVELDLGGIAKGHTADLVVEHLRELGASAALADLGGDIRAVGAAWLIGACGRLLGIADGGVATSSSERRRWVGADGIERHHLIDPSTGEPVRSPLRAVTVVAATASTAEVLAKAALVAGDGEVVLAAGATGLLVTEDDEVVALPGMEVFAA